MRGTATPELSNPPVVKDSKPTEAEAPQPAPIADERVIADDDVLMVAEFVDEAVGHLDAAEASLLKLEEDPTDGAEVDAVFRAFHTIKGVAGFLEFKQIGALAHAAETLLDLARKGKTQLTGGRFGVVAGSVWILMKHMVRVQVDAVAKAARQRCRADTKV